MIFLKAFLVGGLICAIAEILMLIFHITPAKILVGYVVAGTILSAIGIYEYLVEFGGCGATIPLTGFGHALAQGVIKEVDDIGIVGTLSGGIKAVAGGLGVAILFGYLNAVIFSSKSKT